MSGTTPRFLRYLARAAVALLCIQAVLIITGPPRCVENWLDWTDLKPHAHPRYIVALGGGGIPSGTSLTRCYYAAQYGHALTGATFVVSLPTDSNPDTSSVGRMRDELVLRGVARSSIQLEYRGRDTHEQAVSIAKLLGSNALHQPILVVTSEYHMRRALLAFRKTGLDEVSGLLAEDVVAEADLGPWGWFRYGVWSNGARTFFVGRELCALLVYKLRGWA